MFATPPTPTLDHCATVPEAACAAAGGAAASGLVRLETSDGCEPEKRPEAENRRVRDAQRRALRLFKSLSCAGDLLRDGVDERGKRVRGIFLTLTYRPEVEWEPRQITGCIRLMREWCERRGVAFRDVWCAEQHKSGCVHYHAILFLPPHLMLPKPDKQGWWPHGMTKIERCRKRTVGYLIKYATKCRDVSRPWPKGCRLHGHGGLDLEQRIRRAWWVLPKYIREQVEPDLRVRRATGGGWFSPISGEWWPAWSPPECRAFFAGLAART